MIRIASRLLMTVLLGLVVTLAVFRIAAALRETETRDATMPESGRLVATSSGRVYVESEGEGVPVLLVHGSVGWAGLWRDTSTELAEAGYRAVAFDLPPMGFSDRESGANYGRVAQAERIVDVADATGPRPIVVAHSFGAGPALEAALREPNAFRGLVIVNGAIGVGAHETAGNLPLPLRPRVVREAAISATATNPAALEPLLKLFLYRKDSVTDGTIEILTRPLSRQGTTAAVAEWFPTLLTVRGDEWSTRRDEIRKAALPVAIIWGDRDTTTPLSQGQELERLMSGARLQVLPDVGHIPQIEDPDAFHAALLRSVRVLEDG